MNVSSVSFEVTLLLVASLVLGGWLFGIASVLAMLIAALRGQMTVLEPKMRQFKPVHRGAALPRWPFPSLNVQVLYEDESTNRMDEALQLFDQICSYHGLHAVHQTSP